MTYVCSASRDKTIGIWDYLKGIEISRFYGHENWVKSISLFNNNKYLISVGEDKTIRIWNLMKSK